MTHLEEELNTLKETVIEMLELVFNQLTKSKEAFLNYDTELAEEIIHNELRVNAFDINIGRHCENTLALYSPVAGDLRFVLSVLEITSSIERIGDHAENIAGYVINSESPITKELLSENRIAEMFDLSLTMIDDVMEGFVNEDNKIARKIFKQDKELNKINKNSSKIISEQIKKDSSSIRPLLYLFTTIGKLERVGDLSKNIAEEIIFYLDAKVLKHKKKRKKAEMK